ncbi:MAG: zinc ribbon domain-containing protein, partial [Bifidobacteriaceae bacterium]|nr:zinc ribbon domain-containing protein [Bifidobacteriaceae bacterium]
MPNPGEFPCEKCGTGLTSGARFCGVCGAPVVRRPEAPTAAAPGAGPLGMSPAAVPGVGSFGYAAPPAPVPLTPTTPMPPGGLPPADDYANWVPPVIDDPYYDQTTDDEPAIPRRRKGKQRVSYAPPPPVFPSFPDPAHIQEILDAGAAVGPAV